MKRTLRIVAAQINTLVGDIEGNATKIISIANEAANKYQANLIIFPELAITGYQPEDLLLRPELYIRVKKALDTIKKKLINIGIIVGHPSMQQNQRFNSASFIYRGKIIAIYNKQHLPNYGVFDEKRYFTPGSKLTVISFLGIKIGMGICEDLWFQDLIRNNKKAGAELLVSLNASPFDMHKPYLREKILSTGAKLAKLPIIYVNCVGGQDELVFDGGSLVVDAGGEVTQRANFFIEELIPIVLAVDKKKVVPIAQPLLPISSIEERVYQALVLGVRDYVEKNNFNGVIISVSGGIDSALTLAIAVDAIGKERVETIFLPSRYTSKLSGQIAKAEAKNLGVKLTIISIEKIFQSYLTTLRKSFKDYAADITEENLQARCRGTLLMAFSNKKRLLVLSTGNKSETGVGYATLYGDMVGGFCVLKDVPKTLVYRLAKYRNRISPVIPLAAITRAPSAELKRNQKDTDSLPPYPILDDILERYVESDQSLETICAAGFPKKTVQKIIDLVNHNEYKRRQAPPGVKITGRAFGRDRRYPITSKW